MSFTVLCSLQPDSAYERGSVTTTPWLGRWRRECSAGKFADERAPFGCPLRKELSISPTVAAMQGSSQSTYNVLESIR